VVVGIAPLIEELVYRGVLYRAFRDRGGVALGVVGSSLVFAFAHFEPDHFLPLFLIGAALAWISERAGSLRPAIALHAFYNGLSLSLYLVGRFR
jgi:membrane protease YdiL (CAAX protease family)